eukprot:CAMPEP_0202695192 /NCGR_PEP_ID=MMETSP1385-20130828/8847_1 /ASSEMBLY_ACC=CAM_ASM_000861 /TAXON_ID=933848 /ORGANISM="Elphidium margaritaceum" /LENGTH=367 /DNA_ID=CAMNT_0049351171 /DNA_START=17 /DNA_END=1120 /DNA_ORIENTATION=+
MTTKTNFLVEQQPEKDSALFEATSNALAGAAGGIIAMTIVFPLDIIRTQLQANATRTDSIEQEEMKEESSDHPPVPIQPKSLSIAGVVGNIYRKGGIHGFYQALSSQLVCIFVSDMAYFYVVTLVKQLMFGQREVDAMSNLKASTIAGIVNVLLTSPFWAAQTQLMLQSKRRKSICNGGGQTESDDVMMNGLCDAWRKICAKDGWSGLYRGLAPSLWLVSNPIIQFVCYEEFVNALKRWRNRPQLSALTYFVCGALAKAVATFATYPLQVMQTQLRKKDSEFQNMRDCMARWAIPKLVKGDFAPLFTGLTAKLYQTVSNSAIKFMIYEKMLVFMKIFLRWVNRTLIAFVFMVFVTRTNTVSTAKANV